MSSGASGEAVTSVTTDVKKLRVLVGYGPCDVVDSLVVWSMPKEIGI